MLSIRQETPHDYAAIRQLIMDAFARAEHTDGDEHNLVELLRQSAAFIPELSLVAEDEDGIAGYILFTACTIGGKPAIALAPLAARVGGQKKGVGTALMNEGHRIAAELGHGWSVVLGSAQYYPRVGYAPSANFGITAPFEVPDENFMVLKLRDDASPLSGMVEYAPEF